MSTKTVVLRSGVDAWVDILNPSRNYVNATRLGLDSGEAYGFIYFGRPFPLGANVVSATLHFETSGAWAITPTLTVRRVAAKFTASEITWDNKPGVTGATATASHLSSVDRDVWEFDVTSHMQQIAGGSAWYGFRVETTSTALKYLRSTQSVAGRPTLTVTWSEPPDKPTTLTPSSAITSLAKPTVTFDYSDLTGSTSPAGVQVQIDAGGNFTTPAFDSGTVVVDLPRLDLSTTAYAGLADLATTFWRVRVQDAAGQWSSWSDAASMTRDAKGTLTITNPATAALVGTNLAQDPSLELASGTIFDGTLYPVTDDTTVKYSGTRSKRTDRGATSPSNAIGGIILSPATVGTATRTLATAGQVYSFAVRMRSGLANARGRVDVVWRDAAGATLSTITGTVQTLVSGDWTEVKAESLTAPASTAYVFVQGFTLGPSGYTSVGAEQSWFDALMINTGSTVLSYFDGATTSDAATTYAWTGTTNASTSTKTQAFVQEFSPPILWTFSGETQQSYKVDIVDTTTGEVIHTSGHRNGTVLSYTLPTGRDAVLTQSGVYRVDLYDWDTKDRVSTPGDPRYVLASRAFAVALDVGTTGVTGLTASPTSPEPGMSLTWTRASAPDSFTVIRDDVVVQSNIPPGDVLVSGTSYAYTDTTAPPRTTATWKVTANVNGKASLAASATGKATPAGVWLVDRERGLSVFVTKSGGSDWGMAEDGVTFVPLGASKPVRITQGVGGWAGTVTGMLVEYSGKTVQQWVNQALQIRARPGRTLTLFVGTESFECVVWNIAVDPTGDTSPGMRPISFEFAQTSKQRYPAAL